MTHGRSLLFKNGGGGFLRVLKITVHAGKRTTNELLMSQDSVRSGT